MLRLSVRNCPKRRLFNESGATQRDRLSYAWSACKQRRNPLAVVARDASNPSTGLFAKQQVAGRLGFEPRSTVLETAILPLDDQPMVTGSLRVICAGFYSHGRIGHLRTFELPARVVGHLGLEPRTSTLSA